MAAVVNLLRFEKPVEPAVFAGAERDLVPQMRAIFSRLLQPEPPSPKQIADAVNRVLRRSEEARIYHWYKAHGRFPPKRGAPDG